MTGGSAERVPRRLADGSPPARPEQLLARLEALGVPSRTVRHAPVFTVEEARATRGQLPGAHVKNLFLRAKKGPMWLVTCLADRRVDLRALAAALGARHLSFGSEARLMRFLGVDKGAVTPFAVVNDHDGAVSVAIDVAVFAHPLVNAHPLDNAMTTAVTPADLERFLSAEGHPPRRLDFDALAPVGPPDQR